MLAGNLFISLAGSEEQINFSQQSPKMLKIASDMFIHAFFVVFRSFSQNFPLGALVYWRFVKHNYVLSINSLIHCHGICVYIVFFYC